jgi:hypothetical protein
MTFVAESRTPGMMTVPSGAFNGAPYHSTFT